METPTVSPAPTPTPAPRKSAGRPRKYNAPADGTPMTPELEYKIRQRDLKRAAYQANPEALSKRTYDNYKIRMGKQHEALRQFEELKKAFAALVPATPATAPLPRP